MAMVRKKNPFPREAGKNRDRSSVHHGFKWPARGSGSERRVAGISNPVRVPSPGLLSIHIRYSWPNSTFKRSFTLLTPMPCSNSVASLASGIPTPSSSTTICSLLSASRLRTRIIPPSTLLLNPWRMLFSSAAATTYWESAGPALPARSPSQTGVCRRTVPSRLPCNCQ